MHYPTSKVGLLLAVQPITSALISPLSGILCDQFGVKLISLIGLGLMLVACLVISTFNGHQTDLNYRLCFVILGTGVGIFRAPNESTVMGSVGISASRSLGYYLWFTVTVTHGGCYGWCATDGCSICRYERECCTNSSTRSGISKHVSIGGVNYRCGCDRNCC